MIKNKFKIFFINNFRERNFRFLKNKFFIFFFIEGVLIFICLFNLKYIYKNYQYLKTLNFGDFSLYFKELIFSYDFKKEIERVDISINFKNISNLECMRRKDDSCIRNDWSKGELIHNGKVFPIKLRAKGDRLNMHRRNFKLMSFKVDHKGQKRFKGMEEYSIQRPIIRNYTFEFLASKLALSNGILAPRNFYIRLFVNGEYFGIRHVEESMAKELIESKGYRYGPIFSLEEETGYKYGETRFDLSDLKY